VAASHVYSAGWNAWYVRLGMHWPQDIAGAGVFQYGNGYLQGHLLGALIPLIGMAAVCRGRARIAVAASLAMGVLAAPQLGLVAFALSPAVMLWATRSAPAASARHSLTWLAAPFAAAALYLSGPGGSQLVFWAVAGLMAAWVLLGRFDPRYAAAAFALAIAGTVRMLPVALTSPQVTQYLLFLAGTLAVAAVALHAAVHARSS
jgi:hypothetical protein